MASLFKKIIRGNLYYYARECKRVNGLPRIVWQKYLGRAEDVIAAIERDLTAHVVREFALDVRQLLFDKGNNSKDNLQAVADSPYHFIGSLVPTHHPELLKIPARCFRSLAEEGLPGVTAYRTTQTIFGASGTVVVTYNEALFVAQARTLLREISKRQRR